MEGGLGTPDISVADSKVHSSGVYYLGNVVMPQEGIEHTSTPFTSKLSYFGFVAKVSHDGEVEYIREIRGLDTLDQADLLALNHLIIMLVKMVVCCWIVSTSMHLTI